MSAFGGKADVRELPSGCPLIARSGHWSVPCRSRLEARKALENLAFLGFQRFGGAGSLERTRLSWNSLLCRENTGKFCVSNPNWVLRPLITTEYIGFSG